MTFKFKIQGYQTEAVDNTTAIFTGQPNRDPSKYRRDLGKSGSGVIRFDGDDDGYRNSDVELSSKQLLDNLHSVQTAAGVPLSKSLSKIDGLGHGHTAAEVIYDRANAENDFMGLTIWRGALPTKQSMRNSTNAPNINSPR